VDRSRAWKKRAAGPEVPDAYVLVVRYAVFVDGSITGVPVMPTFGTRSPHPRSAACHGGSRARSTIVVPVAGSRT
jgi:hypothetical protein